MRAASRTSNLPYSPPSHSPLPSYLIAQLCEYIMANSTKVSLLVCTFQTLLKFLNWIPLGYIFETQLVKTLVYKFLPQPPFRNDVLACLTEIGSLDIGTIYESLTGDSTRRERAAG